eukprot:758053-Hanusia_phi.AAC.3
MAYIESHKTPTAQQPLTTVRTDKFASKRSLSLALTMLTGVLFPNGGNTTYSVPYYTYSGSLTTPPCSEDVNQTIKIAASDLFKLQSAGQNARPVQAINDRVVRSKSREEWKRKM